MNDFISFVQSNISAIIATLAGGNILVVAATVIKTFSQRNLNRSFELFKEGASGLIKTNTSVEQVVTNLANVTTNVKGSVDVLSSQISDLDFKKTFQLLQQTLMELNVVKESLAYKDTLIESYQKDFHDISIRLMQLEGKSGYPSKKV